MSKLAIFAAIAAALAVGFFAGRWQREEETTVAVAAKTVAARTAGEELARVKAELAELRAAASARAELAPAATDAAPRLASPSDSAATPATGDSHAADATPTPPPPVAQPAPAAPKPAGADEAIAAFKALSKEGLAAFAKLGESGLVEKFRALGPDGVAILAEQLRDSSSTDRFLAAAILEGLKDPKSIPALDGATHDPDLLVRRMASHALAVMNSTDAIASLEGAMQGDDDFGVRANSAYGLAKLGQQSGIDALLQLWNSPGLDPGSRVAVLGGIADVGNPAFAPIFRPLIGDKTKEYTYRILGIMGASKAKDQGALPALETVAADASDQDSLREAARKAIAAIQGAGDAGQ
jgi:hypothetical protein